MKSCAKLPTKLSSQRQRKDVLRNWVLGNHLLESAPDTHNRSEAEKQKIWAEVCSAAERGMSALRDEALDMAESINAILMG